MIAWIGMYIACGTDDSAFGQRVADRFAAAGHPARVVDPRLVVLDSGEQVGLEPTWRSCQLSTTDCDAAIDALLAVVEATDQAARIPITPEILALSLVGRPSARAAELDTFGTDDADKRLVHQLVAPGVDAYVVANSNPARRYLTHGDALALGLDEPTLFRMAVDNVDRMAADFRGQRMREDLDLFLYMVEADYDAAAVLASRHWDRRADELNGDLIAAAPARRVLVYGSSSARPEMEQIIRMATEKEPDPISPTVLRWTSEGWIAAPPPP